jgi:putative pyruvate formate lyase activating enzyme
MLPRIRVADLSEAKKALPRYFDILDGRKTAYYLECKQQPVDVDFEEEEDVLWEAHNNCVLKLKERDNDILGVGGDNKKSLLDLKVKCAKKMLSSCELCERRCKANRLKKEEGHCKVLEPKMSTEFLHWGEEPELVPSHTIFFTGCTFNCVFCQNHDISQNPKLGNVMSPRSMSEVIERRADSAQNVNWVGGDPTSNLPYILETLTHCTANTPQVWNSNMYLTDHSMNLLEGIIDLYLTDFKYGNDECAKRLSNVSDYWEIITRNHLIARNQCEMIIRHLVLPHHFDCCSKPVLEWIAENLENVRVNVMDQYRPEYNARDYPELSKRLSHEEFAKAYKLARDLGLNITDGF